MGKSLMSEKMFETLLFNKMRENYLGLYCVNLNTDIADIVISRTPDVAGVAGTTVPYGELVRNAAEKSEGEEAELLNKIKDVNYLKRYFDAKDYGYVIYKTHVFDKDRWINLTGYVLSRNEDGSPEIMGLGFSVLDDAASEKEEAKLKYAETQETDRLIKNIVSQYSFAYVVNMPNDSFRLLRSDSNLIGKNSKPQNFSKAVELFIRDVLHPADKEMMKRELDYQVIRERLEKTGSYAVEYRVLENDTTMWHEMNITAIDKNNIAVGFGAKDLEITQRHLLQKRFDELFALFEVDLDTERLRIVKNIEGYKAVAVGESAPYETFIRNLAGAMDKEPQEFFMQISDPDYVRKDLASDDKRTYTYKSTHIKGNEWVEVTAYVIKRHSDGTPAMFTLEFGLIDALATSRQEVQEKLRDAYNQINEANLRNELLIEIAHAAKWSFKISPDDKIVGVDFDHNVTNQMVHVVAPDPFEWLKAVHPEDRDKVREMCEAAIHDHIGKGRYEITFRMLDQSGDFRWLKNSGKVILLEDGTREFFGMSINITKQINKEREQQRQLEEARNIAETASRSKTSFLFNMSHDIRTPMNAIIGFTSMAKKHIDAKSKVRNYLNKIDLSGNQLLRLINQVLEMARIDSGKIELSETPVDIRVEFYALTTVLAEQAKINGLRLSTALECLEHEHVFADTARMSSITLNIAGNAMKYTPKGGRIDLILKEVAPRREGYGTYIFTVQDTGIGMSEEYLKVLYDPFTREKSSTVSKIQGTGLGMAIVKNLVDLLGGNIEVQSEEGKGTRFDITVDLRIDNEERAKSEKDVPDDVSFKDKRILLVEDNELNREIAVAILEEEGLIIENADDGSVAVEMLKEKGPDYYDYVLMDIQMPIMNGYDAARAIRSMYPDSRLPIISLSANAFSEDKERAIAAGMNDHVAKPIDTKELFKVLAKY